MNRVIKFRAWDKFDKAKRENKPSMIQVTGIMTYSNTDELDIGFIGGRGFFKQDEIELMQFTGLLDKNGVEIYEGDIVEIDMKDDLMVIEWDEITTKFIMTSYSCYICDFDSYSGSDCEVLGNIHETKEMLD